jgi:ribosomal protein S18 acetylase RimI-like enzyme
MVTLPFISQLLIRRATAEDLPALEWDGELKHFRRIFADAYRLMQAGEVMMWVVDLPYSGLIGQLFVHLYWNSGASGNGRSHAHRYSSVGIFERGVTGSTLHTKSQTSAGGQPYAYIYGFRVQPEYRNQGVGSRLLQTAEVDLAQRGFRRVTLNVARDNFAARRLYERFGYHVAAPEPGIWSYLDQDGVRRHVNEPAWRMEKEL